MSDINSDLSDADYDNYDISSQTQQDLPSATPPPAAGIEVGTDTQGEYDIKSGLFVVVKQLQHQFVHDGCECYDEDPLDYNADWNKLSELFGLTESPQNLLLGENLHPEPTSEELCEAPSHYRNIDTFDGFMKDVETRIKKDAGSITFVLVILMSHGFKDGSFLLSRTDESRKDQQCLCPPRELTDEERQNGCQQQMHDHSCTGSCNARKAYDHLIKPIQEIEELNGKPKLFFIQTCRGSEKCVVRVKDPSARKSRQPDSFIPIGSDTLVFYATIQGTMSWSAVNGSKFLQAFCLVAESINNSATNANFGLINMLKDEENFCKSIRTAPAETFLNAWMLDVCRDVSSLVSKDLIWEKFMRGDQKRKRPYQKQQPEYQCSLRRRLSFLKLLRSTSS